MTHSAESRHGHWPAEEVARTHRLRQEIRRLEAAGEHSRAIKRADDEREIEYVKTISRLKRALEDIGDPQFEPDATADWLRRVARYALNSLPVDATDEGLRSPLGIVSDALADARAALFAIADMDDHDALSKARRCAQEALGEGP